ncbi:Coiled-coil domain-containing protein 97 [Collichthys lucidus]|uniref:Coiled-coil domain-containing protein 97 n=1 Tax=Collichthys lucidus TaxID=240159 RepID=A0A4V6ATC3_COLLU|nr:Coiled-coil domain-containing protein 97 [Collichthys lucidus]
MWGEIEPPVKPETQPSPCESEAESRAAEEPETPAWMCHFTRPAESQQPRGDPQHVSAAESACVKDMLQAVAMSGSPACLKPQDLSAFAHVCSDPRVQHYSKVIQRRAAACTNRTRVRNQRYAALRALQKEGQYFSEEQMRIREPLLYEQYIGQYLTDQEVLERSQEALLEDAQSGPGAPAGGTGGLAHLLLNSYQERLIQNRLQEEQEREEGAQEEEEEDEEDDDNTVQRQEGEPSPEEKALLREEFISQMHQRFLDGKDKDFNYSEVDENPDYDNLDIVSRDAEDKYFDEDDDEEKDDEEEGNMTE